MKVYVLTETQTNDNGNVCSMTRSVSSSFVKAQEHYRAIKSNHIDAGSYVQEILPDEQFRTYSDYSSVITIYRIEEVTLDA